MQPMSDCLSDQVKGQLVRHSEAIDQRPKDFNAEIALKGMHRHLQLDSVDEVQHQANDPIVYIATDTQLFF